MIPNKTIVLAAMIGIALVSCQDREKADITPPEIVAIELNGIASDTLILEQGQTYSLRITAKDNSELEKLELSAAYNTAQPIPSVGHWLIAQNEVITGTTDTYDWTFQVPDSISSHQYLTIRAIDSNGYTDQRTLPLIVVNSNAPSISGTTDPLFNVQGEITMIAGENLIVSGQADDSDGLAQLRVMLWNSNNEVQAQSEVAITGTPMAFDGASFDNAAAGRFRLVIEAVDSNGYKGYWAKWINVN